MNFEGKEFHRKKISMKIFACGADRLRSVKKWEFGPTAESTYESTPNSTITNNHYNLYKCIMYMISSEKRTFDIR